MELKKILRDKGYINGRTISWSKSAYRDEHPNNVAVFNACIVSKDGQSWFGDLDLTLDGNVLKEVATSIDDTLYILNEAEAMRHEKHSIDVMIVDSVWDTSKDIPVK